MGFVLVIKKRNCTPRTPLPSEATDEDLTLFKVVCFVVIKIKYTLNLRNL